MSSRRILNITSRKKADNMLPVVIDKGNNVTPGGYSSQAPLICLFIPNARKLRADIFNPAVRNVSDIYAVGYKEKVLMQVSGGGTLMWRRIVFMLKGNDLRNFMDSAEAGNIPGQLYDQVDTGGCRRVIGPLDDEGGTPTNSLAELKAYVFRGQENVDWSDLLTAPLDNRRITTKYDKVHTISPGNETGKSRHFKFWHPIRRTIAYEDDMESPVSPEVDSRPFSTAGLRGVGDMYVLDIMTIANTDGEAPPTTYNFAPEGTFYWHER